MTHRRAAGSALAAVVALVLIVGGPMQSVLARLSSSPAAAGNTITAGQVFSGIRTTTAWTVGDASSGTTATQNDVLSYAGDARTKTTGAWATAFSASRYFELALQPVLPAGVALASAAFNLDFRPSATGTACFYFEVRVASTSAVLATYGSSGSPVACNATTSLSAVSTSIPILTSTSQANDLAIRVYMRNSGSTKTAIIDRATVTGTTALQSFTLHQKQYVDASTGTPATTIWPFATNDTTAYTSAANWTTAFVAARYLGLTFPATVPGTATISAVSLSRVYRTATIGDTVCWYLEVYNGVTLLGSHGSGGSPISCATSSTTYTSDTVSLGEISTAADAGNVTIRLYNRSALAGKSVDTLVLLSTTWSRP
jgi:hypothetical protein